jgi:hypothetical protein
MTTTETTVKYYMIHDLDLVGKTVDGKPFIYINHEWTFDIRLMDRIYGYDETEHDTPYAMFNSSIMETVSVITEEKAMEFIKKTSDEEKRLEK